MRRAMIGRTGRMWAATAAVLVMGASCDGRDPILGPGGSDLQPRDFDARYEWVLHGWEAGGLEPIGHAGVILTWTLPSGWDRDPFRVYARRAGSGDYIAISTITSCADGLCSYTDINVTPGQSYDYFVATVDEARDEEYSSAAIRVDVPSAGLPQTPAAPTVVALDGALYLTWPSTGAERYRVFLERIDNEDDFIEVGETDGTAFLDGRAENGIEYGYRIAAIDEIGQFSDRSAIGAGVPRPDYSAEFVYAFEDNDAASGFRFEDSETVDPVLSGTSTQAQWRLETVGGTLSIVPRGETLVTAGIFTSALTCGPSADFDCEAITTAPAAASFGSGPVTVYSGNTYVFRVRGDDGALHYAKIRVQGTAVDAAGDRMVVFDWAYQLLPNDPNLSVGSQ
jgi:hypothetical protein